MGGVRSPHALAFFPWRSPVQPSVRRIVGSITTTVIVAGMWLLLAPPQLGGSTQMLGIHGISMEPNLHAGDLAIVRRGSYEIGDVVAYRSELVGTTLLHRIIAIEDGIYSFQGDNNDFVDPDHPTIDAILGEQILRIPNGADLLRIAVSPPAIAGVAGLLVFLFLLRRDRGSDNDDAKRSITMSSPLRTRILAAGSAPAAPVAAIVLIAIAFVAAGIGAAAMAAPATTRNASTEYHHQGTFTYTAQGPGSVYADGVAETGDAIFLNVSDRARVRFAYRFASDADATIQGRIALRMQITDVAGWSRTFVLQKETPFAGRQAVATGTLHLAKLGDLLARLQEQTGVVRSVYRVNLQPAVELTGTIAGIEYQEAFTPSLTLEYDGLVLRYVPQIDATEDALAPTRIGAVSGGQLSSPPTLRIAGRAVPARPLGLVMGILAFAAASAGWILLRATKSASGLDVVTRIRTRFADRIVELQRLPSEASVVIASPAGFERLAEASDQPILEHADRYGVSWLLREGETLYSFRIDTTSDIVLTPDAEFTKFLTV